jgi:hypothetical protein
MALLAQAAIHQLRCRLGKPCQDWDAKHLASSLFRGSESDIRVVEDTIVVTYYNAPNANLLRSLYEGLPAKLIADNVDPHIPLALWTSTRLQVHVTSGPPRRRV